MHRLVLFFSICVLPIVGSAHQIPGDELLKTEKEEIELKKRLREQHLKEMNEQVESQGKFIADWPKYSQDVEQIKKFDDKIHELEKQLNQLEERKAELLKNQNRKSD